MTGHASCHCAGDEMRYRDAEKIDGKLQLVLGEIPYQIAIELIGARDRFLSPPPAVVP